MKRKIANIVTIARFVLTVACLILLSLYRPNAWLLMDAALGLFIIAGVSDILDGYLARRFDAVSRFGRVLDPTVDKVLICGAFIMFAGPHFANGGVTPWVPIILVVRELLVTAMRGVAESSGASFGANWAGKLKMACQFVAAGWIMLHVAHLQSWPASSIILDALIWLAVAATVLSAVPYVSTFARMGAGDSPSK